MWILLSMKMFFQLKENGKGDVTTHKQNKTISQEDMEKLGVVACACNPANSGSYKLIQPRTQVQN